MGKVIFEIKSIVQHWGPPFGKEVSSKDVEVSEGNSFDNHPKAGSIFKLITCKNDKALVEFSEKFTLKGHEHPRNRRVWIDKSEPVSFTYLWGNNGMTKSLTLKQIGGEDPVEIKTPEEVEARKESMPISEESSSLE